MAQSLATTPLIEQYEAVRARYPGHIVLFRVGDFFETFGDDAKRLASALDIQLTARGPDATGARLPMAGVPYHAVDTYLARLVRRGFKVALCDQVEDARQAKGLVRREVTRVVTPGTVVEDGILGGPDHNFLAVVYDDDAGRAFAAVDVSTGDFLHGEPEAPGVDGLLSSLAPLFPREILVAARAQAAEAMLEAARREFPFARVESAPPPLLAADLPEGLRASIGLPEAVAFADRTLAAYLKATQPRLLAHLALADGAPAARRLQLDAKTLRHLEISRPMNPDDPGGTTLLKAWDETGTAAGHRTLSFWLCNPLADEAAIRGRLDAVESLVSRGAALGELRQELSEIPDIARIASRLAGRRVRPPELGRLRDGLEAAGRIGRKLSSPSSPAMLSRIAEEITPPETLHTLLKESLPDILPATEEEGGLFRPGRNPEVDRARVEEQSALSELEALEREEQEATGIRTLKVRYNQVFGYYIEVTRAHLARIPPHYRRRQTVAQAERFTTERLETIAEKLLDARETARTAEATAWETFLGELDAHVSSIHRVGRSVGSLDALQSFACVAQRRRCVRPAVDSSLRIVVRDGRHPVLDHTLQERFVPNDVELDAENARLLVLTGPNMSGKSTYMRQVGLLVVLAQAGSFVPAKFVQVGIVSGLYTRMGFTDEIGRGKSSFMVEMSELAEILRSADHRALVLLDEVGRGTSTFDGLAIAWAALRHLHDVTRCRAILATHYHQLTQLVEGLSAARLGHLAAHERPEGIVFLHRLVPGSTDRSYGIHVARIAGLPPDLLAEAQRLLRRLEGEGLALRAGADEAGSSPRYTQAMLFASEEGHAPTGSAVEEELRAIDVDHLTPVQALQRLAELRAKLPNRPEPPR
jgi:DNA mismatch repair protein MutS